MRLYLQEANNLIKFNLPAKIDGSLLFTYKNTETDYENSINVDAENNEWILKSNGSTNIVGENMFIPSVKLMENICIPISTIDKQEYTYLFCLPSIDNTPLSYNISDLNKITIGKDSSCNIIYNHPLMAPQHAVIVKNNNYWYIQPTIDHPQVQIYVNDYRIKKATLLTVGDVIFINGLKIIWMNKFIKTNNYQNLVTTSNLSIFGDSTIVNNYEITPVSELEKNIELYKDNQCFTHIPRIRLMLEKEEIKIDSPPGKQVSDEELPLIISLGSSLTMAGMSLITCYNAIFGVISGERTLSSAAPQLVMGGIMIFGSLIMPRITNAYHKKQQRKKEKLRQKKYGEYLDKKTREIETIIKKQTDTIIENNYDLKVCQQILIQGNTRNVWIRKITDDDFLTVRVGFGSMPAYLDIKAEEEKFSLEDDNLLQKVFAIKEKYKMLNNIPIAYSFKNDIVTSLVMFSQFNEDIINSLVLQLLCYHSPLELKIVIITNESNEYKWDYLKYVPHCWNDSKTVRYFSSNTEELKQLSEVLDEEYISRKEKVKEITEELKSNGDERENYALFDSYYLIITDNFKEIRNQKFINEFLETKINYGFSMIAIDKDMKNLPKECSKFIVMNDTESAIFSDKFEESTTIKFKNEYIPNINMRMLVNKICNIPIQEKDQSHQLPPALAFLEMYNVGKIEQLNIRNRWKSSDPTTTLKAPIGVHENGETFYLDLHEKFDGPHGLIAGSTGSGKSEFIITYILSMALNYDPKEVQFVLIDYKGGGLAGAFENREQGIAIPHLAGTITNLDTAEMNRTLVSIESELKRRQHQFNTVREKIGESTMDIYKYQKLFREGIIEEPISHLFIISDEFAELKSQQPEFMAQLISTARIGRSLGVHLILATQKPSGVVNDQIWSNSKFKVCLKVQSRADSMEMLKRPEAASIKETGRFYLQVGYDEYFDIGQSAWSGEKYNPVNRIVKKTDDSLIFVDTVGNVIKRANDTSKIETMEETKNLGDQLTNIIRYLNNISNEDQIITKKLWFPPLKKEFKLSELLEKYNYNINSNSNSIISVIGEYDSPRTQKQGVVTYDLLNNGNLLIYGMAGSGKENLLNTIIYSVCLNNGPEDVNFYIGDFGAETLRVYQKFPQVGDVFITSEDNKLNNFIKMLDKEFERRKKEYSEFGGTYKEYCKISNKKDPIIVVVLNNYENFVENFSRIQDVFSTYIRDGSKYGIIFIITTTQSNSIRSKVTQNFLNKIALKMPNATDYRDLLGSPRTLIPADNYGRGVIAFDGQQAMEFQTANIDDRENITQTVRNKGIELKDKYKQKAKKIPILPEKVYVDDIINELKGLYCVPIGIEKNSLEVYVHNFIEKKINVIVSQYLNNHIYFIYALIKEISMIENTNLYVMDAIGIYKKEYQNTKLYNNNLEQGFIEMYKNIENDKNQTNQNVYIILGVKSYIEKIGPEYQAYFEKMIKDVNTSENNIIIFADDYEACKDLQVEDWYRDNIDNTFGIWLGENIGTQIALGVMSLTMEDKNTMFPCIGYPIYKGNHMIIKYAIDGVDRENEE